MSSLVVETTLGEIKLTLRRDVAPTTVSHVVNAVGSGVFKNSSFYRSDFVIQFGLHGTGREVKPALAVNESKAKGALSNLKGAVSVAHWDVPGKLAAVEAWFVRFMVVSAQAIIGIWIGHGISFATANFTPLAIFLCSL